MPTTIETLDEDRLLRDYLRNRTRSSQMNPRFGSPGHELRTCAECGRRTAFTLDPEGTWFRC
ncbi:MAG: hypothetical protein ACRDHM_02925, partial [Actinomycetota bacterium]